MNLFHSSIDVGKCNDQEQNFFVVLFLSIPLRNSRGTIVFFISEGTMRDILMKIFDGRLVIAQLFRKMADKRECSKKI